MIALKEARLCREILPDAHLELFYMDIRTCGKGYESYLEEAKGMGIRFTRGRPGEVLRRDNRLFLQVEAEDGSWREDPFDMVVLSMGFEAAPGARDLAAILGISLDEDGFLTPEPGSLSRTGRDGVYVAGAAGEPRDIPEAVMQAHEAAALAAAQSDTPPAADTVLEPPATDPREVDLKILISLCDCSGTLASALDWDLLKERLSEERDVAGVDLGSHLCLRNGLSDLGERLRSVEANALVVGACTPRWLNARLRRVLASAGLDPHLVQIVNLREQGAWSHGEEAASVTAKALAEIRAGLARCRHYRPFVQAPGAAARKGVLDRKSVV